nr:MAG TPA: Neisseria meningitidis TspB protein [Inoviridae sp.]
MLNSLNYSPFCRILSFIILTCSILAYFMLF